MRRPSLAAVVMVSALVSGAAMAQDHDAPPPTTTAPAPDPAPAAPDPAPAAAPHAPPTRARASTRTRARHAKSVAPTRRAPRRRAHASAPPPMPTDPGDGTSLSVGRHNRGRLLRGHELVESESLRFKAGSTEARFGTDELVGLLERAAHAVITRSPGSRLTVGDLSRRRGGRFSPHRSHQSGRDVDLAFYTTDPDGAPLPLDRFFDFRRDLTVRGHDEIHFDLVRNWQLVEALVTDEVPVQWIFVSRSIRARLLEEGARQGASADALTRADAILSQPSHGGLHNDQFHVRIYCPASDRPRCVDDPPLHPWMAGAPATAAAPPTGD